MLNPLSTPTYSELFQELAVLKKFNPTYQAVPTKIKDLASKIDAYIVSHREDLLGCRELSQELLQVTKWRMDTVQLLSTESRDFLAELSPFLQVPDNKKKEMTFELRYSSPYCHQEGPFYASFGDSFLFLVEFLKQSPEDGTNHFSLVGFPDHVLKHVGEFPLGDGVEPEDIESHLPPRIGEIFELDDPQMLRLTQEITPFKRQEVNRLYLLYCEYFKLLAEGLGIPTEKAVAMSPTGKWYISLKTPRFSKEEILERRLELETLLGISTRIENEITFLSEGITLRDHPLQRLYTNLIASQEVYREELVDLVTLAQLASQLISCSPITKISIPIEDLDNYSSPFLALAEEEIKIRARLYRGLFVHILRKTSIHDLEEAILPSLSDHKVFQVGDRCLSSKEYFRFIFWDAFCHTMQEVFECNLLKAKYLLKILSLRAIHNFAENKKSIDDQLLYVLHDIMIDSLS